MVARKTSKHGAFLAFGGLVAGAIGAVALVLTNLTTIINLAQHWFPDIGPFDASLAIADASIVGKPILTKKVFKDGREEEAVDLRVLFIETTKGKSNLANCRSWLRLSGYQYDSTSPAVNRPADSQQQVEDEFVVPREVYGGQAAFFRGCARRVAGPLVVQLPDVPAAQPPAKASIVTTYIVCVGEYARACGGNTTWLACGADPMAWARQQHPDQCRKVSQQTLSDVGGNRCGYATVQVTCVD